MLNEIKPGQIWRYKENEEERKSDYVIVLNIRDTDPFNDEGEEQETIVVEMVCDPTSELYYRPSVIKNYFEKVSE